MDGGGVLEARHAADLVAAQAARRGADEISASSVRNGGNAVDASSAITSANTYIASAGMRGTVHVAGDRVTVTIRGTSPTKVLGVIGVTSFPISETESARGIESPGGQP